MKAIELAIAAAIAVALSILAYVAMHGLLNGVPENAQVKTSYEDVVVVLLTTVTVIFTVAALVIGILAFLGPRAIKREAAKYAERAVLNSISEAMKPGGQASKLLEGVFPPNDGPVKTWMEGQVKQEVRELLPLFIDEFVTDVGPVDPAESDDEGKVD